MKFHPALLSLALTSISYSAFIPSYDTGAGGAGNQTFSGGSWTGDGTVQPFIASSSNANSAPSAPVVTGFSNGVLELDTSLSGNSSTFTPAGFTTSHDVSITGGTATLTGLFNSTGSNNHNYAIKVSAGTTCIEYTMTVSQALHSRRRTGHQFLPWLGSLQMPDSANVQVTY